MRYSLFVYLCQMFGTFQEAAEYIAKSQGRNRQLLSECIEGLGAVNTVLQNNQDSVLDPEIQESIGRCRRQCQELLDEELDSPQEEKTRLAGNMKALWESFRKGISVKYKVVFFAELGQKWDSMSSLYEAFRARSDCETAVVIEPIFREATVGGEKKRDVIYQDYLTPMGIPNIPYEFYDLSKELPDMAFISNPYESVTLEQFWPDNIAKYSKLVYVPYYTNMASSESSVCALCGMPVATQAWRILAQSEEIMKMHRKYAPKHGANLLVTGLPKWDNILELKKAPETLPKGWKEKISGKKVFLWNSHFAVSPSEPGTLLDYGQAIVDVFSGRKDIALIWRPHPMTSTIFKLYASAARPFWEKLVHTVESAPNMVFDTGLSYVPSFQASDALLSDFSSIIAQYMLTGKPVLWLKNKIDPRGKGYIEDTVHIDCLEQAESTRDIAAFIDRIVGGIDPGKEERLRCVRKDLPFADGHIGERTCSLLLEDLQREDGLI